MTQRDTDQASLSVSHRCESALRFRHMVCYSGPVTFARQVLGRLGEDLACQELERRGHAILDRRYRTRHGELDIVSRDRGYIVFVEVKARMDDSFGDGSEAVTLQKQQRVVAMASDYLTRRDLEHTPCRFDVVAVDACGDPPRVVVYEDAFRPGW